MSDGGPQELGAAAAASVASEVAAACPSCGEPTASGDLFCEACGHDLTGAAPAPAVAEAPPPPAADGEPAGPPGAGDVMARAVAGAAVAKARARSEAAAEFMPEAGDAAQPPDPAATLVCRECGTTGQWMDGYCGVCGAKQPQPRDHVEQSAPGVAAVSDKGRRHAKNEDAFAFTTGPGFVVAVVCDGVSTTVKPEDASQAAADAATAVLAAGAPGQSDFAKAFDDARSAVLAVEFQPHPQLGPPSCTYLASVITDDVVLLDAFGDCRAYWVAAEGSVEQLTVDDSWATQQIIDGMPPAEAFADPRAHSITRWIARDADPSWRPVNIRFEPPGPGRMLLVSDGVWNYAAESPQLAAVIEKAPADPLGLARHLVDFANQAGGADNITAVVVDLPLQSPEAP